MSRFVRSLPLLGLVALAGAPSARLDAQSAQRWSLQFSGLYVGLSGDTYEGLKNGMGFEGQVRYNPSAFSLGLGYQSSSHALTDGVDSDPSVLLSGGFLEPRYVIDVRSDKFAPYVSGRLAVLEQSITLDVDDGFGGTEPIDLTASGTQINVGGGVLMRMSRRINLDLGATFGRIKFDDVTGTASDGSSYTFDGTSGSGQNLVFRIGVAIGLGR